MKWENVMGKAFSMTKLSLTSADGFLLFYLLSFIFLHERAWHMANRMGKELLGSRGTPLCFSSSYMPDPNWPLHTEYFLEFTHAATNHSDEMCLFVLFLLNFIHHVFTLTPTFEQGVDFTQGRHPHHSVHAEKAAHVLWKNLSTQAKAGSIFSLLWIFNYCNSKMTGFILQVENVTDYICLVVHVSF